METGFFNGGLLNFVLDEQKKQSIMNQSVVEKMTDEQKEFSSEELEKNKQTMKSRDAAWETHKKEKNLKFPERLDKDGNVVNLEEYHAKHKWSRKEFFTNVRNFDWEKQKVKNQPEWLQKELKEARPFPDLPKEEDKDSWGVMEWPEWVRMSDGSVKKVHVGSSFYDIDEKEKTQAWQNRSELFSATWSEKSDRFIKTDKDKQKDQELKSFSKFLYLDVNDKDAWSEYIEEKKDWRGRKYNDIKKEYVELFNNAYRFQEKANNEKHKPAVFYNGLYYENPYYEKGAIFRENIFGW